MSAVIQIVVALTVMMPPGSFRSLQQLASREASASSVVGPFAADHNCSGIGLKIERQPHNSQAPLRARSWTKVTFTVEQHCDCSTSFRAGPIFWLSSAVEAQPRPATVIDFPSRTLLTHLSPRDALLALHKLLT
jgi:hypothetical protein